MNKKFYVIIAFALICILSLFLITENLRLKTVNTFTLAEISTCSEKNVYLTFDDGPSDKVTPKILDVLKEEDVKATFFIIGKQAETRKKLLKRAHEEGHTLAVHSYSHEYNKIYSSPKTLIEDIDKCNTIIKEITGKKSNVYRFPGGSYGLDDELIQAVSAHGLRYVDWNASTCDAEIINASPEELYKRAISTSADKQNIVLLAHDSTSKTATANMLKKCIKYYKDNGYAFLTF